VINEKAQCHCGNITAFVELTSDLAQYTPRACDCDFCTKHGAAYLSDPNGKMSIHISDSDLLSRYQQGDKLVELIICRECGVLVAVTFTQDGIVLGGINSKTLYNRESLPPAQSASPKMLAPAEKTERWKQIWFKNVLVQQLDA